VKTTVTISLDLDDDRDLLAWMERQPNRSEAIRQAIRAHISGGVSLGDVYQAVQRIERKIEAGAVVTSPSSDVDDTIDEPPEAAAALDALANL
jgi:Arc/MetJ-type ribon-helix-helix transcriptional regulator